MYRARYLHVGPLGNVKTWLAAKMDDNLKIQDMLAHVSKLSEIMKPCLVPILIKRDDLFYSVIGTSVYVRFESNNFLISASHVWKENTEKATGSKCEYYYVPGKAHYIPLGGQTLRMNTAQTLRDRHDIVIMKLSNELIDQLSTFTPYPISENSYSGYSAYSTNVCVFGYPNSRNKKIGRHNNRFFISSITNPTATEDDYHTEKYDQNVNVLIQYDKNNFYNPDGQIVTAPNPEGISGGGIVSCPGLSRETKEPDIRLIGITIEKTPNGKFLVGTRLQYVLTALNAFTNGS